MTKDILEFQGVNRWLSNFWPAQVLFDGRIYPTVENAYQAAKAHPSVRAQFCNCKPGEAKRIAKKLVLEPTWDREKVSVMRRLLAQKFSIGSRLSDMLVATGDCQIVEGNHWGDTFWGVCNGVGENNLGKLLMERRAFLKAASK